MANYKARGIILKRTHFGEADRLLTIFTYEKGKIKAIAKGARKQNSRLGGHLELFCLTSLVIAEGRNLDIITEAEIIKPFLQIRNNLGHTNLSYYLAEVVDLLTVENEKHLEIFELLLKTLTRLDHGGSKQLCLPYFEINFLKTIGYEPELKKCLKCLNLVEPRGNSFDFEEGGLVCRQCGGYADKISAESIKVLRLFLKEEISIIDRIKVSSKQEKDIVEIVKNYIRHIRQEEFKSRKFV